jgi:hypothetical protein
MPKCHIGHHNFCEVPKLFGDHMHVHMHLPNIEIFVACSTKLPKNSNKSWQVWEVTKTKTSSDASHVDVTWGAKLNKLKMIPVLAMVPDT